MTANDVERKVVRAPLEGFLRLIAQDAVNLQILLDSAQVQAWQQYRADVFGRFKDIADGPEDSAGAGTPAEPVQSFFESLTQYFTPPWLKVIDFDVDLAVMIAKSREVGADIEVLPLNIGYSIRYGTKAETSSRLSFTVEPSPVLRAREAKHHGG